MIENIMSFFFGGFFGFVSLLISAVLYFLPTVIALAGHRRNTPAIFLLNLLLGWTFIGWVVALVWSVKK